MTREDAIKEIEIIDRLFVTLDKEERQALKMAIEALSAEPCEDAISREQAIIIASGYCHWSNISEELAKLPSVTPKQKMGHWEFPNSATKMICTCSCCGGDGNAFGKDKFCRTCGAKMESTK